MKRRNCWQQEVGILECFLFFIFGYKSPLGWSNFFSPLAVGSNWTNQKIFLYPPWQICFQKSSYKMLVPLIKHVDVTELFLELDAKDVAKYLDSDAQTIKVFISPSVKCKRARHRWLLKTWFTDIRVSWVMWTVGFIQTLISWAVAGHMRGDAFHCCALPAELMMGTCLKDAPC